MGHEAGMLHPLALDGFLRITRDFDRDTLSEFVAAFHGRLAELDAVARRERRRPCAQDDIDRLDAGIAVGKVVLRRPSVAAMDWLRTCAAGWWGESTRAYAYAMAYACAHRGENAFIFLRSRPRASWICWRWAFSSGASEEALLRAAISLLPPPEDSLQWFDDPDAPKTVNGPPPDLMAVAMRLSSELGGTPGHWLWEVADEDFWKAVCDLADKADAEMDASSMAAGKGHADGSWWRKHRKALARCEAALEADAKAWAEKRNPKDASRE
jgi:hypothetical protein